MTSAARPELVIGVSAVAIEGRALLIGGPPGSGKSALCLALIDRGARLIGDDGIKLTRLGADVMVAPPPRCAGLLEVRNVGLVAMPLAEPAPLALILTLEDAPERLPERAGTRDVLGCAVPCLGFAPGAIAPALRAEWALRMHGLEPGAPHERFGAHR